MRRLIVNADDFGLTDGVNRAIVELHSTGALTSATLMAASPRFDGAVALARKNPSLGMGCHIVLVDGIPVSDPATTPSLLERPGAARFRSSLGKFAVDLFLGRIRAIDIEREATAQILRLQQAEIAVTHVDTHKHTHMFPAVLDAVMRAAESCGVRAIRNPFEPSWSRRATHTAEFTRRLQVWILRAFYRNFLRQVSARGFFTTHGSLGVLATGTLDEKTLRAILRNLPVGTWELVCHPGYLDDDLRAVRTRLRESRAVELAALRSIPGILGEINNSVEQVNFGMFQKSQQE